MSFERGLDLHGRKVLASPADEFLSTPHESEGAVVVHSDDVSGAQPAVGQDPVGLLGHPVVTEHDRGVAQLELAGTADADLLAVLDDAPVVCLLYTSPSPRDGLLSR